MRRNEKSTHTGGVYLIKVLYLLNHAGKAGTERYLQSLVEKLDGNKIKAYFAYNEKGLLVDNLKNLGVETYRIGMRHPFDIPAIMKLSALCKKLDIDIIHTQYLRENYIAPLSRIFNPKARVIWTNHSILPNNMVLRVCNRILTKLQSGIIAVCNKGKDMMIKNGNDGRKIKVIFNGVDPSFWGVPVESSIRSEFNLSRDTFILLCGSRFAYDKGHEFLINSINELKKIAKRKFVLILANDGPLLEDRKQQVKDLKLENEIIFAGFRKDVKNLYAGADLYVNSSWHEALSMAIIEVLAAGVPVIATDMGGNADIINDKTNCGILVEYNDAKGMAEAINKVMEDDALREELKKNALNAVKNVFNLEKTVSETYNVYKACLETELSV